MACLRCFIKRQSRSDTGVDGVGMENSWFSRILTSFSPHGDRPPQHAHVNYGESSSSLKEQNHAGMELQGSDERLLDAESLQDIDSPDHPEEGKSLGLEGIIEAGEVAMDISDKIEIGNAELMSNWIAESSEVEGFSKPEESDRIAIRQLNVESIIDGERGGELIRETNVLQTVGKMKVSHWEEALWNDDGNSQFKAIAEAEDDYDDDDDVRLVLKIENISNMTSNSMQTSDRRDPIAVTMFPGELNPRRRSSRGTIVLVRLLSAVACILLAVGFIILIAGLLLAVILLPACFQAAAIQRSVAYIVISNLMGRRANARKMLKSGFKCRIPSFILLAIMLGVAKVLHEFFFSKIFLLGIEQEKIQRLNPSNSVNLLRLLATFNNVGEINFWVMLRIGLFVVCEYLIDALAYCIYMVACWVIIMETNFWGLGAVKRSFHLTKGMVRHALVIHAIEGIVCGDTCHWLLQFVIGQFGARLLISVFGMYFWVLWLIFYISARFKHDNSFQFSHRTFEEFLDRF
ncbi:hypothetical protein KP509_1Z060900 [Ceratopteris richardii]|nr:hypothetical protein KP509_1Z060900 [Ceratopteris richardii]